MNRQLDLRFVQSGILLFWALWLTAVASTNLLDALKQLGVLPESWTLASYNFSLVANTVGAHGIPAAGAAVLFGGVILWELSAAVLFWLAFAAFRRGGDGRDPAVVRAFAATLALFGTFLLTTELTVNYLTAPTHTGVLMLLLASLLVVLSGAHREEKVVKARSDADSPTEAQVA